MMWRFTYILFSSCCYLILSYVIAAHGATYYIDYVGGNDGNNGTSISAPWKLAPGMQGCLITDANNNACRARAHATTSGDSIILKGGVTWPSGSLSWDWYFGDSTYFGVDETWYTGAVWTRPVLDLEGTEGTASPEGITGIMRAYGDSHIVDNIEFKGVAQLHGGTNEGSPGALSIGKGVGPNGGEVKNCYFHGWSHGGTATADNMFILSSPLINEGPDLNLRIHHNVFDGSDTTRDMAGAYKGSAGHFYNNYVGYMQNGIVAAQILYVWGNTFEEIATTADFDPSQHHQSIEQNVGQSIIYNNLIKNSGGGGTILTYGIDGHKDYIFNNVIIGDGNQALQLGTKNGSSITLVTGVGYEMHVFNNTVQLNESNTESSPISGPTLTDAALMPLMAVRNNHLIGPIHSVSFGAGVEENGTIETSTLGMTNAQASIAGYLAASAYPYTSPLGGTTINAGYDLTDFCGGIPSSSPSLASTACLSDSPVGVSYNATTHTVSYPFRPPVLRSNWDIGAYEYPDYAATIHPGTALSARPGTGVTIH